MAACLIAAPSMPYSRLCVNDETEAPLDLKSQSDDALVELVRRGETNAFPELVRRYQRFCMTKANSILRNRDDAEDEVQTAWLQVWTHLGSYRGQGSFDAWLSRIVSNRCLMRLRTARYAPMTSVDEACGSEGSFHLEIIDQRERPDQVAENDQVLARLNKEVNAIPPTLRDVLVAQDLRQRLIGDIAADLGISVPAAKSRLMRARIELKKRLDKHYGEDCAPLLQKPSGPLTAFARVSLSTR
jgi:RNA polymerase sigma-70 factor, ECF subfamily